MRCPHVHADYPHEMGRLPGCRACDLSCHCTDALVEGTETICVFVGHQVNFETLSGLPLDELESMAEDAAQATYDGFMAQAQIGHVISERKLYGDG